LEGKQLYRLSDLLKTVKEVTLLSKEPQCEMCGADALTTLVEIDHVELYACQKCAKFGKPVIKRPKSTVQRYAKHTKSSQVKSKPIVKKPPRKDFLHDKILIDGYGSIIQEARRERGLGRAEFAKLLKEKETLLGRIEMEKVIPTDRIVAKIERELSIDLKTELSDESSNVDDFIPKATTIGSIAKIKRKKN
jgi:putative transcription factor